MFIYKYSTQERQSLLVETCKLLNIFFCWQLSNAHVLFNQSHTVKSWGSLATWYFSFRLWEPTIFCYFSFKRAAVITQLWTRSYLFSVYPFSEGRLLFPGEIWCSALLSAVDKWVCSPLEGHSPQMFPPKQQKCLCFNSCCLLIKYPWSTCPGLHLSWCCLWLPVCVCAHMKEFM